MIVHFPPTTQIIGNVSVCAGDTATMSAGAGFSEYLWTTGETSQSIQVTIPGDYYVTVTDANGCTGVDWTTVSNKIVPNANINWYSGLLCGRQYDHLRQSVFHECVVERWRYGYQVDHTDMPGEFSVTVTGNNGCFDTDTVEVTINPLPIPRSPAPWPFAPGRSPYWTLVQVIHNINGAVDPSTRYSL